MGGRGLIECGATARTAAALLFFQSEQEHCLRKDRVELRFKDELRVAGIKGEWHVVPDGDSTALIEVAKSVDMTIMGQFPPRADGAARLRPADVVMAAGRPVLVVPYAGTFETVGKRILWLGTGHARRTAP